MSFNNFLYNFLAYTKLSKCSSAKYYLNNILIEKEEAKKTTKKKLLRHIKEIKATIWSWTIQKSTKRWKTKVCGIYKKYKMRKNCPIIIIRNYFNLENLVYYLQVFLKECKHILKSNDLESSFDE